MRAGARRLSEAPWPGRPPWGVTQSSSRTHMWRVRDAIAICLFFGVWLGVWSAAWLAGVYFFGTETPALFGGFFAAWLADWGLSYSLVASPRRLL